MKTTMKTQAQMVAEVEEIMIQKHGRTYAFKIDSKSFIGENQKLIVLNARYKVKGEKNVIQMDPRVFPEYNNTAPLERYKRNGDMFFLSKDELDKLVEGIIAERHGDTFYTDGNNILSTFPSHCEENNAYYADEQSKASFLDIQYVNEELGGKVDTIQKIRVAYTAEEFRNTRLEAIGI